MLTTKKIDVNVPIILSTVISSALFSHFQYLTIQHNYGEAHYISLVWYKTYTTKP